jgi:hypothetical protein
LISVLAGLARERRVLAGDDAARVHRAVDHVVAPEMESGVIEESQQTDVAPGGQGPDLVDAELLCFVFEPREQALAQSLALPLGRHADDLQAQCRIGAAELALEPAPEHIACQRAILLNSELQMQRRLTQRGLKAALEVAATRAPGDARIDLCRGAEVLRRESPQRDPCR